MRLKISEKSQVNYALDTSDKNSYIRTRDRTFITTCIRELKSKGETICFHQWQIEEIKKHIDIVEICYNEGNDCYFLFSKR